MIPTKHETYKYTPDRFAQAGKLITDAGERGIHFDKILMLTRSATDPFLKESMRTALDAYVAQGIYRKEGDVYYPNYHTSGYGSSQQK